MTELIRMIVEDTGLSERDVLKVAKTAPFRYKTYQIAKRRGGFRTIAQPTPAVKILQRTLVSILSRYWKPSSAAMAYVKGRSIVKNAAVHSASSHVLKMDFKDFFNSIGHEDFKRFLDARPIEIVTNDDTGFLISAMFWAKSRDSLCLSVGAPSSPFLSNVMMHELDSVVAEWCKSQEIKFTRYADDLTFSGGSFEELNAVQAFVQHCVLKQELFRNLKVNDSKTVFVSKKYQRRVTGLVLTNDGNISIGRSRKRLIRAMLHHFALGKLELGEACRLAGFLAFAIDAEPSFVTSLERVFGREVIKRLLSGAHLYESTNKSQ